MPTSSQSKILSVIDYQLIQQQTGQDEITKTSTLSSPIKTSENESRRRRTYKNDRRSSIESKSANGNGNHSSPPPNTNGRRLSFSKNNDVRLRNIRKSQRHSRCLHHEHYGASFYKGLQSARPTQRSDILHVPIINLNNMAQNQPRISSSCASGNDKRQNRTIHTSEQIKSVLIDGTIKSSQYHRNSIDSDTDYRNENGNQLKQTKKYPSPMSAEENTTSASDVDREQDDDDDYDNNDDSKCDNHSSLLNENARRLLILGTIRPSKTFYKNLSEADADHLMEYFRKMKTSHQRMTTEEIHQELSAKFVEYKPKIFFDSASVTKNQVATIEKMVEEYADKIRTHKAEFAKLDNPMRFVIKQLDNDKPLTTIPREYNDCFITLVTHSDPLRKSDLVTGLIHDKLSDEVKANSLDISYFPGGVNYDVPRDEIDESGQMNVETYQKLKKRLNSRKVWYFNEPPLKKPNSLLAIIPSDTTITIDHQRLLNALYDRLRSSSTTENSNIEQQILSIEFVPLSCIFNSNDMSNQFVVDCGTIETKQILLEKPLKIVSSKHSVNIELQSYDETIQREYEKFVKSEKYRELIKNHDSAVKRALKTK